MGNLFHGLLYLLEKFGFSDEDRKNVPQDPFKYLRETIKNTAFRASQNKILYKLIYIKKLLVDTNLCERCINEIEDFKHMLCSCRFSVEIWKGTERQINERFLAITVVLLRVLQFLPTIPLPGRGIPPKDW